MRLALEHEHVVVYDDVLGADDLAALRRHVSGESYSTPTIANNGRVPVWRPTDGEPFCTREYATGDDPFPPELALLAGPARDAAARHPRIIGDYTDLVFRSYLYPRGTRISWHGDPYAGALAFYVHPRWGATWGGELMVVDGRTDREIATDDREIATADRGVATAHPGPPRWMAPSSGDDQVSETGIGIWIAPKPNRLVLTAPSAYHSVHRVDDDAGDQVRAAVVGFYRNRGR